MPKNKSLNDVKKMIGKYEKIGGEDGQLDYFKRRRLKNFSRTTPLPEVYDDYYLHLDINKSEKNEYSGKITLYKKYTVIYEVRNGETTIDQRHNIIKVDEKGNFKLNIDRRIIKYEEIEAIENFLKKNMKMLISQGS